MEKKLMRRSHYIHLYKHEGNGEAMRFSLIVFFFNKKKICIFTKSRICVVWYAQRSTEAHPMSSRKLNVFVFMVLFSHTISDQYAMS